MNVLLDGKPVTLSNNDFVAAGGEARVYAVGGQALKIHLDPARVPPADKLAVLAGIRHPRVIAPRSVVTDPSGKPIGFAMPFLADATPVTAMIPRSYCQRVGLAPDRLLGLVTDAAATLATIHGHDVCVVDINPMNLLADPNLDGLHFIDADSWQTPAAGGGLHRATALLDSVRDRHATPNVFDQGTDWFSFAVVAFQLLLGVHPYKGKHPAVKGLDARMVANISVLDPKVSVPGSVWPSTSLSPQWLDWFTAVFQDGVRCAPPSSAAGAFGFPRLAAVSVAAMDTHHVWTAPGPILDLAVWGAHRASRTADAIWLDGRRMGDAPKDHAELVFSSRGHLVVATIEGGQLQLWDAERREAIHVTTDARRIASRGGDLWVQTRTSVVHVALTDLTDRVLASVRPCGNVSAHASRLFHGCVIDSLLGAAWATVFPRAGRSLQLRLEAMDGYRVLAAEYEGGVLVVVGDKQGQLDRLVYRVDDRGRFDLEIQADVADADINLAVIDGRVAVLHREPGVALVFDPRPNTTTRRRLEDDGLDGLRLRSAPGALLATRDDTLLRLRLT